MTDERSIQDNRQYLPNLTPPIYVDEYFLATEPPGASEDVDVRPDPYPDTSPQQDEAPEKGDRPENGEEAK